MVNRIEGEGEEKNLPPIEKKDVEISKPIGREKKLKQNGIKEIQPTVPPLPEEPQEVSSLEIDEHFQLVDHLLKESAVILRAAEEDPRYLPSVHEWAKEQGEELMEIVMTEARAAESWAQFSEGALSVPGTALDTAESYYAVPMDRFVIPLTEVHDIIHKVTEGVTDAYLIFKVPESLNKGASLIYKRTVLKMVELQVQKEELTHRASPEKINELKAWIKVQNESLHQQAVAFGLSTLSLTPRVIHVIGSHFESLAGKLDLPGFGALVFFAIANQSYAVHQNRMQRKTHVEWMKEFKAEVPVIKFPEKKAVEAIDTLLQKRKNGLETRMKLNEEEFNRLADTSQPLETIRKSFKEKGFVLKNDIEDLKNPETRKKLLKQYAEHKETLSLLTRNGLRSLTEKKHQVERKFLNFKLASSSASLTLTCLVIGAITTLKILAIVGILALPILAMVSGGLSLFVFGIALMTIGLLFLRHYKPNLFSQIIRGVQIRLAFYNIPRAYYDFRLSLTKIKSLKNDLELSKISAQMETLKGLIESGEINEAPTLPKELKPLFKKYKTEIGQILKNEDIETRLAKLTELHKEERKKIDAKQEKLEKKIAEFETSLKKWQDKITPLKQRLIDAGWKDFERATRLKEPLEEVIVEGIFHDENLLDPQTKLFLHHQLGINLDKIRESENSREELTKALKEFYTMDDSAMITFINQQKARFELERKTR